MDAQFRIGEQGDMDPSRINAWQKGARREFQCYAQGFASEQGANGTGFCADFTGNTPGRPA